MIRPSPVRQILFVALLVCLAVSLAGTLFFATKVLERRRYVSELISSALGDRDSLDVEEIAIRLSHAIYQRTRANLRPENLDLYSRWESKFYFNVTSAVALRYGGASIQGHTTEGACGIRSRVLLNSLWRLGIPARKLQLLDNDEGVGGGHTMVEVLSGRRWVVISPSDDGFVWRTPDGEIATAGEIRGNPAVFSQIFSRQPGYPYRFDRYSNIRWEKLPSGVRGVFNLVLGEQRYENAATPRLYDKPRTLFLWLAVCASAFFALTAYAARPRKTIKVSTG